MIPRYVFGKLRARERPLLLMLAVASVALAGCRPTINSEDSTSATSASGGGSLNLTALKALKILPAGTGTASPVAGSSLQVGQSLALRAALFDLNGTYLGDTTAFWSFTNSAFPSANLSSGSSASGTSTFAPTTIGTTFIQAVYAGSDSTVVNPSGMTGAIAVNSNGTVASMQLSSGDGQSGTVNNNLSSALTVRVLDAFSQPVAGTQVSFSVTQGGGSIVTASPVTTDSNGYAAATVKLGTVAGSNSDRFRATSVANGSLTVDFVATAVAGPASQLVFTTQPGGTFASAPFVTQPAVTARDSFGNTASLAGSATIAVQTGTGSLGGVTTASFSAGVASWSSLSYSIPEAGVVLRATAGALTADTAAFTVGGLPPGACQRNDSLFTTADGGCKDLTSGLVWSAKSPTGHNWHSLIWDADYPGSAPPDADDFGRTNDYSIAEGIGTLETDLNGYCHALIEGGKSDWRPATLPELIALYTRMQSGVPPYLASQASEAIISATPNAFAGNVYALNLITGLQSESSKTFTSLKTYCVRGNRVAADRLQVTVYPGSVGAGTSGYVVKVRVKDSAGNYVGSSGRTITLSATTVGTLGGTVSATTNHLGEATLNAWTLSTAGNATVTASSAGLTSATFNVKVGPYPHTCLVEDAAWVTADGGCKSITSGKAWSRPAPVTMTWYDAVWGSTAAPFNVQPDGDDGGRTNDYDGGSAGTYPDNSTVNYCHELVEGGYTDWRLPTTNELNAAYSVGTGAPLHFGFDVNRDFWSSSTHPSNEYAKFRNLSTGVENVNQKYISNAYSVLCVRP